MPNHDRLVDDITINENIDFILSHFRQQHELFPRTIMTARTNGQVKIEFDSDEDKIKNKILKYFKISDYKDCRINSFPFETEYHIDFDVKNKTAADFIFIDLDLNDFETKYHLDKVLSFTLKKFSSELRGAVPTVLWTGNGYHIYQPLTGFVLESEQFFYDFLPYVDKDLTSEFIRFSEKFFTRGKSDKKHIPSIKSCLTRVPGTFNSKNGNEVRIIQRWNGNKPDIRCILIQFRQYLIQKRNDYINDRTKHNAISKKKMASRNSKYDKPVDWIESLLQTPIKDHRKTCLWRVLIPYLINVKKMSNEEAYAILRDWLDKCDHEMKLDFDSNMKIRSDLKQVKDFKPLSLSGLKKTEYSLYRLLVSKNISSE